MSDPFFVAYEARLTTPSRVPSTVAEKIVRLANVSRPAVLTYREIAEELRFESFRRGRPMFVAPSVVPAILRRDAPDVLAARARERAHLVREARERRRFDGRRQYLDERAKLVLLARARVFVLDGLRREVPAYTLAEIGRRFGPEGLRLSLDSVRRVLLALPGGRELLRARLEAWRATRGGSSE